MLLALLPASRIGSPVVVDHRALAVSVVLSPLPTVLISISVFIASVPVFFVPLPSAFVPLSIGVDVRPISIFLVVPPLPRVAVLLVNDEFPIAFLAAVAPRALVDCVVFRVDVAALAVLLPIDPLALVDISVGVVVGPCSVLQVAVPLPFVPISIRVVVGTVALPQVVFPLAVVLGLIDVLELPHAVLLILAPFAIVGTAVEVGGLPRALPAAVSLLAHVDRPVGEGDFGDLGRQGVELRLENASLGEVVGPVASFLVLEVHAFEVIPVLVLVPPVTMLQAVLETSLEEELPVAVELPCTLEDRVPPLSFVLEAFSKHEDAEAIAQSPFECALIDISILVVSAAFSMGPSILPGSDVLDEIVFFLGAVLQPALSVEGACLEISLVAGAIAEGVNPMPILLIVGPISLVPIAVRIAVDAVPVLLPPADTTLVAIAVAQVLQQDGLALHSNDDITEEWDISCRRSSGCRPGAAGFWQRAGRTLPRWSAPAWPAWSCCSCSGR